MFQNYFKTAWRHLLKNRFYSAINIIGLAIGLAVGIMILLWVQDETSYNRFFPQLDQLYKVNSHIGSGAAEQVWTGAPSPVAVYARQSMPEAEAVIRVRWNGGMAVRQGTKKIIENNTANVDPAFFSFFGLKMLKGDAAHPFNGINSIVLTSSLATKYFGTDDPLGKTLTTDKESYTVSGVIPDFPSNSTMGYDAMFPMDLYARQFTASGGNGAWKTIDEDLGNYMYDIYLRLRKDASAANVEKKLTQLYWQHRPDEKSNGGHFTLQAVSSLHLVAADGNTSALQIVRIFLLVAVLTLAIACINYVNLATARAMLRSREVSMRKIIGAARYQLFIQFIVESALLFVLASVVAFTLIWLLLPIYNTLSGKHLLFSLRDRNVWLVVGTAVIGTMALAGVYPALLLSSFKPLQALKGKLSFGMGNVSFRKALVVTQFVFSIGLIAGTLIIGLQLRYIREKDIGMDKEHIFSFGLNEAVHNHYDAVRQELLKQPGILAVAASDNGIANNSPNTTGDTYWEGKPANSTFLVHPNGVDPNLIPLLKMQMVAGHNFTGTPADSGYLILNETAVRNAGIKDPVGKRFDLWQTHGTIIGVVKDFNYASLHQAVEPFAFYYDRTGWQLYVKASGREIPAAIAGAQRVWKTYAPGIDFQYSFLDEDFNNMYQSEKRTGILFSIFAVVAILISCLGLLGLASYTAQVKTKEIGIRKVLGATTPRIIYLLARDFIWLVGIAFLVATPVIWYAMHGWLEHYAYRITIPWWVFLFTGGMVIGIALVTVGVQAIRAALANPVKALRTE